MVNGVRGYIDGNGIAQLNLEDVARGLGFVDNSKEIEYVRWNTVMGYLKGFGFSQEVAKESFIPENIFYRLAMKAKNEIAEKFQALVADEILPAIRKTGSYLVRQVPVLPQNYKEALVALLGAVENNERITKENLAMLPKAEFYDVVTQSDEEFTIQEVASILANKKLGRNNLFKYLISKGVLINSRIPYRDQIEADRFRVVETSWMHPKTKEINIATQVVATQKGFDYIVKLLKEDNYKVY
ncbi:phage antirepressor KilAC domain-containing protein [Pelosinus sp. IPA-1]|uniref:phage antirepressor KilAC domain-containing protein n=1 Tax=Pelosinus sp. IPA-1 TaxID=3029569 RepID=UPI00243616E7|nr:phage antirepressor KilAC domain-containing protein [Pelosinus sp. IPA-1]GMB02049.1 hypothetical protein PIPA1_48490 [Pelosinus sp. IPA-1]